MNTMHQSFFHYPDGSVVMEGDSVTTGNVPSAVILSIIQPGSDDAEAFDCPNGGILIEEDWGGKPGLLVMEPPDGAQWEDLSLIKRKER